MNKEEIKKAIKVVFNEECKECYFQKRRSCRACLNQSRRMIKGYIKELEQKESILNKVTDKLKEDIESDKLSEECNEDGMEDYWRGRVDIEEEILNILEGE